MTCSYRIPGTSIRVVIAEEDLFAKNCVKVIHTSATFDTDESVVNTESLIGQFLLLHKDMIASIDAQIDSWISHISEKGTFIKGHNNRKWKFPKGTLCPIRIEKEDICLAAFCDSYNQMHSSHMSVNDYIDYWDSLWGNISDISISKKEIAVAVPGGNILSVGSGYFTIEQKLGIILHTFFRCVAKGSPIQTLNICLSTSDAALMDFSGWENHIIPFLFQMANVPILMRGIISEELLPPQGEYDTIHKSISSDQAFIKDVRDIAINLASLNGRLYEQFDGNRKHQISVNVKIEAFLSYLNSLSINGGTVWDYLTQRKGIRYDRNKLFQFLGVLHERTTYFGDLNRKSIIALGLKSEDGTIPARWEYLGSDLDNIISYVGQKLSEMKQVHQDIYDRLSLTIPEEFRKKG